MDFKGKTALITGASRGIGAEVAKSLAAKGAHVILLARTQGALEAVDDEIRAAGGQATLIPMDLRRLEKIDQLGPSIYERFGKLDMLVGNAAILGPLTPVHQVDPKDWEKIMTINFHANVRLARTLDPLLRAAPAGRAVFTTSGLTMKITAYFGPYTASKSALNVFAETWAAETQKTAMKIGLVDPGLVDTEMLREAFPGGYPPGLDVKQPADVVGRYLEALQA